MSLVRPYKMSLVRPYKYLWFDLTNISGSTVQISGSTVQISLVRLYKYLWFDRTNISGSTVQISLVRPYKYLWFDGTNISGSTVQISLFQCISGLSSLAVSQLSNNDTKLMLLLAKLVNGVLLCIGKWYSLDNELLEIMLYSGMIQHEVRTVLLCLVEGGSCKRRVYLRYKV